MHTQTIEAILEVIEETRIPANTDLLPEIMQLVKTKKRPSENSFTFSWEKSGFLIPVFIVALLLFFSLTVPEVRARTAEFFQRFGLVFIESENEVPSSAATDAESPVTSEVEQTHWMSLEEAQTLIPFTIPTLKPIPNGLVLRGAIAGSGPYGTSCDREGNCTTAGSELEVVVSYVAEPGGGEKSDANINLTIYLGTLAEGSGYAAPKSEEQIVFVNGHEAVYVQGAWEPVDGNLENLKWDNSQDTGVMSWADDVFTYVLSFYNLGLDKEAIVKIAESVHE